MSIKYVLLLYLITFIYGYKYDLDFMIENQGDYNLYLCVYNNTGLKYLGQTHLGFIKNGIKKLDIDFLKLTEGNADIYLYFENKKGEYLGKTYLGIFEHDHITGNIQQYLAEMCNNKTNNKENEHTEVVARYNKNFIDSCLQYHTSNNLYPCPGSNVSNNGTCLFWRANRECISAIKSSVLMESLLKFCKTEINNPDCMWNKKQRNNVDSLTKWLSKETLNNLT